MKPTEKSQPIEDLLDSISPLPRKSSIQRNVCCWCKRPILGFRDSLSMKEYKISGMCQNCQDDTFGGDE